MLSRYSWNGNATPPVLMFATLVPVDGVTPGASFCGTARGAASRGALDGAGAGGGVGATDVRRAGCLLIETTRSAGRATTAGAGLDAASAAGAATSCTR